ncbi:MAG TPA: hypothetical protein VGO11_18270 [Chthoniobacteraceae bacterium]|nr:hypothetical protein [Chthoniobacteraceae bacterium]
MSTLTISLFAKVTSLEPLVLLSLVVHPALSLVLGFWSVSRLPASGWRVVLAILVGIALAILNGIIAFAGCTTGIFNR